MMDLSKKDVAELLTLSIETVDRLIEEKGLPCYKLGGLVRFNRSEIENWIMRTFGSERTGLPLGEAKSESGPWQQFGLYRAIHKGDVLEIDASSKEDMIYQTMRAVAERLSIDADLVAELFLEREALMSTALCSGFAVPHTREFLLNSLFDAVVVVYPKTPLPFGALDGQDVHTLFFLFACDDKRHLSLLAKIAHFAATEEHTDWLKGHPNKASFLEKIKEWETSLARHEMLTV